MNTDELKRRLYLSLLQKNPDDLTKVDAALIYELAKDRSIQTVLGRQRAEADTSPTA